jgi:hypothetical protein
VAEDNIYYEDMISSDMTEADKVCADMIERLLSFKNRRVSDAVFDSEGKLRMADTPEAICAWIEAYGERMPEDYKVWIEAEKITVTVKEYTERQNKE